ncbi:lytTr DNA-binding domain protein [Staphylococcus microti]|uniref:LytTr DNA-binding domain protein n=1 Tax=Staphylococcus microti TaxID=569857 RepID=A0A380GRN4_9STAP|nr:LytTR family DNA-binding domain-containing protein [Staphylococcus microti]PNZ77547.1 LytTR family transcriptional regulator [Staphylococcus microti]SUM56423.1 lytTr DNA-binding domain protein [Staphylococcus microti]
MKEQLNVHLNVDTAMTKTDVTVNTFDQEVGLNLVKHIQQYEIPRNKIGIKTADGVYLIVKSHIIFAEIFDKELTVVTTDGTYQTRMTLRRLQEALPDHQFIQISKSSIVNIEYITKVAPSFSGNLYATLSNRKKVTISRRYVKNLTKSLGI